MSSTKTFTVTKQMVTEIDGGASNPGDDHLPIGKWDPGTGLSWRTRVLVSAPVSFSGMTSIVSARLYLHAHTAAGFHANNDATGTIHARRKTSDWSESSAGTSTAVDEVYGGNGKSLVTSGYAADEGCFGNINQVGLADNTLQSITITEIVRDWFEGSPNYGIMLYNATSETDPNKAVEFYSRHDSGSQPYIEITYETNTAPLAPDGLSPVGDVVAHSNLLQWDHNDPDTGDKATNTTFYLYDAAGAVLNSGSGGQYVGSDGINCSWGAYPMVVGRRYKWKARTYDGAAWGPYCALQTFYYEPTPGAPTLSSPAADAIVSTLTPTFSGTPNLSGDSTMADAEIQVFAADGTTLLWDSGFFAATGSAFSKVYAGPALGWSTTYQWRARIKTSLGTIGGWGAKRTFTTDAAGAPLNTFPFGLQASLTPQIGFDAQPGDTIDHWRYEVYEADGVTLHASASGILTDITGGTHVDHTYAGTALLAGTTYFVRFQYTATVGGDGPFSALSQFATNAAPTSPTLTSPAAAGFVTTLTPTFEWVFEDPDKVVYGDTQEAYTLEVRDASDDSLIASLVGTTELSRVYDGATPLVFGTTYKWRVQTSDGTVTGPFSSYQTFTPVHGPSVSGVQIAAGDLTAGEINTPTPTVEWTYSHPDATAQAYFEVSLIRSADSATIFDSGMIAGADVSYVLPNGYLINGETYMVEVLVRDANGLDSTPTDSASYLTTFAPPAALTGLTTVADLDTSKVTIAWDQSVDPNFDHYEVWRRVYGTDTWDVLEDALPLQTTSYDDYTAALNVTYEYAALQVATVGTGLLQGDFDPLTTGLSGASTWYFVAEGRDDLTVGLTWVDGVGSAVPVQQQIVEALGRPYKIVVEGLVLGDEGTLTVVIDATELDVSDRIETLVRAQLARVLVKSPAGKVFPSKLGSISRTGRERGGISLSITYTQIEAA